MTDEPTLTLTAAEWKVMRVLWSRYPLTVREAAEALEDETGWAYSTVKTLLSRLADKGTVAAGKRGNARIFAPLITEKAARRAALRTLIDRAFDGTFGSLVHHLVADQKLSTGDRDHLRALLERELTADSGKAPAGEGAKARRRKTTEENPS